MDKTLDSQFSATLFASSSSSCITQISNFSEFTCQFCEKEFGNPIEFFVHKKKEHLDALKLICKRSVNLNSNTTSNVIVNQNNLKNTLKTTSIPRSIEKPTNIVNPNLYNKHNLSCCEVENSSSSKVLNKPKPRSRPRSRKRSTSNSKTESSISIPSIMSKFFKIKFNRYKKIKLDHSIHQRNQNILNQIQMETATIKNNLFICDRCSETFEWSASWRRHRKMCRFLRKELSNRIDP